MIIIEYARDEAMRTGSYAIGIDHLVLGILRHGENSAVKCLQINGIQPSVLKERLDDALFAENPVPYSMSGSVKPSRGFQSALSISAFEALKTGAEEIGAIHLLLAVSRTEGNVSVAFLREYGMDYNLILSSSHGGKTISDNAEIKCDLNNPAAVLSEQLTRIFGSVNSKENYYN